MMVSYSMDEGLLGEPLDSSLELLIFHLARMQLKSRDFRGESRVGKLSVSTNVLPLLSNLGCLLGF